MSIPNQTPPAPDMVQRLKMHWRYYQALEADVANTCRYVEFCKENWGTFSIEFTRLLLACGSEADVVAKLLCSLLKPTEHPESIRDYRRIITTGMPRFAKESVEVAGIQFAPWKEWEANPPISPAWWKSYNDVKHDRVNRFSEASLGNVVFAIGGLNVLMRQCFPAARYLSSAICYTKLVHWA